jgi:hypothetical protein
MQSVLGMMRFATYDSPILLEALASLLAAGHHPQQDARQLAARALLQASYKTQSNAAESEAFRKAAGMALSTHDGYTLERLEREFEQELVEAATWTAAVEADEQRWIAAHADVEAEFHSKYYQSYEQAIARGSYGWSKYLTMNALVGLAVVAALTVTVVFRYRGRSADKPKPKLPPPEF